ncbi:sugar ABC transporter ATP-binding protein [Nakamurella sp. PAMC28650]|uniref:sugar ABC transporter ATP-binding protein n=1 Tax=Nakamurella sp. PAMC28650 TaxID=2762325 RepID=UPI001C9A2E99|nr:sugar ABC transporter ATP-binding protein [Nakamurella sp. PAMC28650]
MTVPPPARPVLQVGDLAKSFGLTQALAGVDVSVLPATVHALLGGNGSGKSSMVKILAGVYHADRGTITVNGSTFDAPSYRAADGHRLGLRFVHQDLGLIEAATISENMAFTRGFPRSHFGRISWRTLHRSTAALLERFEIDAGPKTPVASLRPADRTMVAIARALGDEATDDETAGRAPESRLLVLDEPTASLPRHESEMLLAAIRRRAAHGQTIVLISHHLQEVLDVADTITVLRDGRVAGSVAAADADEEVIVSLIAGRAVQLEGAARRPAPSSETAAALQVTGLQAGPLQGVDITVRPGEIVGVTGLLGSGRSSLVRAVFGALPRRAGTVQVHGVTVPATGPSAAMAAGIALVPEDRGADAAFIDHSVQENLSATVTNTYWRAGWMNTRREQDDAWSLIDRFGIKTDAAAAPLSSLSGGNQQKAILARWLRREPRVLLLDEPSQGVDIVSRADIYRLIRHAAAQGCAVLVASSDAQEIDLLCDRAVVLAGGRVAAELDRKHLDADTLLRLTHTVRDDSHLGVLA